MTGKKMLKYGLMLLLSTGCGVLAIESEQPSVKFFFGSWALLTYFATPFVGAR